MRTALRHRLIGLGFKAWVWSVRTRRLLGALGRPRLRGVEHFTIPVKDLAMARRFYCDVLGGELMMTVDDAALRKFGRPSAPNGGEGSHHLSVYSAARRGSTSSSSRSGRPRRRSAIRTTPSACRRAICRNGSAGWRRRAWRWMARCGSGRPATPRSISTIRPAIISRSPAWASPAPSSSARRCTPASPGAA